MWPEDGDTIDSSKTKSLWSWSMTDKKDLEIYLVEFSGVMRPKFFYIVKAAPYAYRCVLARGPLLRLRLWFASIEVLRMKRKVEIFARNQNAKLVV
jgi:hypothetical protein